MTSLKSVLLFFLTLRANADEALGCYLLNVKVYCASNFVKFPLISIVIRQDAFSYVWSKRGNGCFRSVITSFAYRELVSILVDLLVRLKKLGQWLLMVVSTPFNCRS